MKIYSKKYQIGVYLWLICFFLIELVPCPLLGQELTKKKLLASDYSLWGTLRTQEFSPKGDWISYKISYQSADTLFLKNTKTLSHYSFAGGHTGRFISDNCFAYLNKKQRLSLISLNDSKNWYYDKVDRYDFNKDGQRILLLVREINGSQTLIITNRSGKLLLKMHDISDYVLNNSRTAVLYTTLAVGICKAGIIELNQNTTAKIILSAPATAVDKLCWSPTDNSLALFIKDSSVVEHTTALYFYQIAVSKLHRLQDNDAALPNGKKLAFTTDLQIRISSDDTQIFFPLEAQKHANSSLLPENVEVWKADDTLLYPTRKILQHSLKQPGELAVWNIPNNKTYTIGKGHLEMALLINREKNALTCQSYSNNNLGSFYPPKDYYITNTVTGKTEIFLQGLPGLPSHISNSPDGKYIAYFRNHSWWIYDMEKKKHLNCAPQKTAIWDNSIIDPNNTEMSYGVVGWSNNGTLLVYDPTDIWEVDPSTLKTRRITHGKEKQLRYRLATVGYPSHYLPYSSGSSREINLKKDIILSYTSLSTGSSGYTILKLDGKCYSITRDRKSANRLFMSKSGQKIVYEEQSFDTPPRIIFQEVISGHEKIIVQSNTQHQDYHWGHQEVIHYTIGVDTLNAALLYPQNYDSSKKYPMITWIYETMSPEAYQYVNPSLYNSIGLNVSNLTAKGYFILLPDITYRNGNPGASVVKCVTAAVEKVLSLERIIPNKIGLAGHSFGGYEVNFLLTHTSLFAAAVSGSSVVDPITGTFSYSDASGEIDYWRYENQQFRIGKSLYEDTKSYLENSPLMFANMINTPLLTWAGKQDIVVRSTQSQILYAALRRQKKNHIMLLYPDEGHSLSRPENQLDLTSRVESWFGYYLKNEPASWIKEMY